MLRGGLRINDGGFSPPGLSQASNPTLEALGLRRHKAGVMKGMSQDRNALHGGKQVHGKAVGVFPLPECPKLALDPGQVLSEDLGRSGGKADPWAIQLRSIAAAARTAAPASARRSPRQSRPWS